MKNRVLLIPLDFHRHSEGPELFGDMVAAFEKDNEVMMYSNVEKAVDFKPNLIFFQGSLDPYELRLLKETTGALVTMWTGDARYIPTQSLMMYKDVVDAFFLPFSGKTLDRYSKILGKWCFFIWEPIQNWRFIPNKELNDGNITFIGRHYENLPGGKERNDLMKFIHQHLPKDPTPLNIYGGFLGMPDADYKDVPKIYNNSYAVICENNYNDIDEYFTPRNIGAIAAGSCALMRYVPGIEKYFTNMKNCIYYKNKYELLEAIDFINHNPNYRNGIAQEGFKLANEKFSYQTWAKIYMEILRNSPFNRTI